VTRLKIMTFFTNKLYEIFVSFTFRCISLPFNLTNKSDKNYKLFSWKHSGGSDGHQLSKGGRHIETVSFDDARLRFRKVHTRRQGSLLRAPSVAHYITLYAKSFLLDLSVAPEIYKIR